MERDLERHREELGDDIGELKDEVMGKVNRGRQIIMFVPDKIRQAGSAGKRAGMRVGRFCKERPLVAGAIGVGAIGLIGAALLFRHRRANAKAETATATPAKRTRSAARTGKRSAKR
jgi:hypothetical protein